MISLALIGKNITHSKSEEIYRKILNTGFSYSLLDYESPNQIPSLSELFKSYDGISVTSPYKKHFLTNLEIDSSYRDLQAINCIKKIGDELFQGINTDFLAIDQILDDFQKHYDLEVVILGNGSMSFITQKILEKKQIKYSVISRSDYGEMENFNLDNFCRDFKKTPLIINSCSREYCFEGQLNSKIIFWDYNYEMKNHQTYVAPRVLRYVDGMGLLELQARYAAKFWGIG